MFNVLKIFSETMNDAKNTLKNNLPNTAGVSNSLITNILNWSYALAGLVAVGFIIFGAWKYISSNGDPARVKNGTSIITYAVIGLVIVLAAAAITNFVFVNVGDNIK